MCMGGGGGGGGPYGPEQMTDKQLAQKVNAVPFGLNPKAAAQRDQQFNNKVAALKQAYNGPKPTGYMAKNRPISPYAVVVDREGKYKPGSDEYFVELAARELNYRQNPVARAKAAAPYQAEIDRRAGIQAAFDQQKADREKILADNNQAMLDAQAQQRDLIAEQQRTTEELRAKQDQEMAAIRAAGQAATQSMQIQAIQPTTKAPTASLSGGRGQVAGSKKRGSASLRIGNTGQTKGVGPNIAV